MCGILGFIGTRWRKHATMALHAMRQRGPDEQSVRDLGEAVLCHARLAVIDLSGGHQPMSSPDARYTLVFNGEIYNFHQLRQELERMGFVFITHSDTEVLLHGFTAWGEGLLSRLDGMFAFAIWDSFTRSLFAARDPLGIKPLMYAQQDGGLIFASILTPFLILPDFPRKLDPEALRDYLAFQTPLTPHTFLRAVRQLPPGHKLHFDAKSNCIEICRYWTIPSPKACPLDREDLVIQIDEALKKSVRRQIVADVPLGAFLSGGIDSSLMVRYMAEVGGKPLKTFNLRFVDSTFDESPHARIVARHFGADHHELESPAINGEIFANAISDLDQPLADPAYVMTYALSKMVRQQVTVAISGDGGDEIFCGYPRFLDDEDHHPQRFWQPGLRHLIENGLAPSALLRRCLWGKELLHYRRVELGPWPGRKNLAHYLNPEFANIVHSEATLALWLDQINEHGGHMNTATLMRADLWTYLSENCLVKTDRASMAHGLEIRVPILGQSLLDAVLKLPPEVHNLDGGKSLLTEIARRTLPEAVWNRKKHGFSTPLGSYFSDDWHSVCEEAISETKILAPFLNPASISTLWRKALAGRASLRLTYTFVVLLIWLRQHSITT